MFPSHPIIINIILFVGPGTLTPLDGFDSFHVPEVKDLIPFSYRKS